MPLRKLYIGTLGCKLNQFDSAQWAGQLAHYFLRVNTPEDADLMILNTCTVTHRADADGRKRVRRLRRAAPQAFLAVTGCGVRLKDSPIHQMVEVDAVFDGPQEARRLLELFDLPPGPGRWDCAPPIFSPSRTRGLLKIQEGCDLRCSYCIIPQVRGPSRSIPLEKLVMDFQSLLSRGFCEVVLTGVNTGTWGKDLHPRSQLSSLLRALCEVPGNWSLRLNSLEPLTVTPSVLEIIQSDPRIASHIQIPLQSGSDTILRAMNRPYSAKLYRQVLDRAYSAIQDVALGADVLVGFPGEGDKEFAETVNLIQQCPLTYLHIFSFSARPGTPAACFPPVPSEVIKKRSRVLRDLGDEKTQAFVQSFIGKEVGAVLLGQPSPDSSLVLTHPFFEMNLSISPAKSISGALRVKIQHVHEREAFGDVVGPLVSP